MAGKNRSPFRLCSKIRICGSWFSSWHKEKFRPQETWKNSNKKRARKSSVLWIEKQKVWYPEGLWKNHFPLKICSEIQIRRLQFSMFIIIIFFINQRYMVSRNAAVPTLPNVEHTPPPHFSKLSSCWPFYPKECSLFLLSRLSIS